MTPEEFIAKWRHVELLDKPPFNDSDTVMPYRQFCVSFDARLFR